MKNTKTVSTILNALALSMLISAMPALAMNPNQQPQSQPEQQPQQNGNNSTGAVSNQGAENNSESIFKKYSDKIEKFWTEANTPTKVVSGIGLGFVGLLGMFFLKKTYKFILPIFTLGTGALTLNHMASKPANKEFCDKAKAKVSGIIDSVTGWVGNLFGNLFSKK